jgi:hypothetical protein
MIQNNEKMIMNTKQRTLREEKYNIRTSRTYTLDRKMQFSFM